MPGHTFSGDHGPVAIMQNGRQIAGAVKAKTSGTGRAELDSIYKASLPSVTVHGEGKQDKLEGKNLFDDTWEKGSIRYETGEDFNSSADRSSYIPIEPDTDYVLSQHDLKLKNYKLRAYDKGKKYVIDLYGSFGSKRSIKIHGKTEVTYIRLTIDGEFSPNTSHKIQLEKGSTPTPYEPYCGGIPAPNPQYPIEPVFLEGASITDGTNTAPLPILRALPDGSVRDEMDVVSGTVVRRIWEEVFDGSPDEVWKLNAIVNELQYWESKALGIVAPVSPYTPFSIVCNRATASAVAMKKGYGIRILSGDDRFYVNFGTKGLSIDQWIGYLKEHPFTIWYALATPIIEHYDPSILRQHPGYTQLIQQGGFREAEIEAEYWKEMGE